ncbi:MAG: transglycosylase SLT domain-containing protein [Alistipes sp.]|nr:transglycosylase SLT domain-containing protein [Alistipes sp.]
MLYEEKVTPEFVRCVDRVAQHLGVDPSHLMAIMWSESRLNPTARNPVGGAVGLIQFMPATAKALGTSSQALLQMSAVEQMVYVERFFRPYAQRCRGFEELYLACFFPVAIGKPDTYILQTSRLSAALIAQQNPGFDLNRDQQITVGEFKQHLRRRFPKPLHPQLFGV